MKNDKGLPVMQVHDGRGTILNPEILTWVPTENQSKTEGRGLVWVEESNPLKCLDPDAFAVAHMWGEVRVAVACVDSKLGPMMIEPPRPGDRRRYIRGRDNETLCMGVSLGVSSRGVG